MATLMDIVKKGAADRSVTIRIIDSTNGTPETGVVFNTSGIDLWYRREGAAKTSITEATLSALTDAHSDGGFLHIGDGEYRLDLPDAAFATGANHVDIGGTVTGMVVIGGRVRLVNYDPEDTVRLGLTALPNAAAEAAGGLYTRGTGAGQINQAANGMIDTNPVRLNNVSQSLLDLADFADAGYDPATNKVQGVVLTDTLTTYTGNTPQTGDAFARLGAPAGASVSADIAAIEAQTDDIGAAGAGLSAIPWSAAWDAEVQSEVQDALEVNHLDHLLAADYDPGAKPGVATALLNEIIGSDAGVSQFTANALELAPTGGSAPTVGQIADAVWDEDTTGHTTAGTFGEQAKTDIDAILAAIDTEIAAILAAVDTEVATIVAATTASAIRAALGLASANLDTQLGAIDDFIDTEVGAIKTVTDQLVAAQAEPTGVPAANETPLEKLAYLFMALRNKLTVTATSKSFYDDGGAVEWSKAVSDDGTTYTENEGA